MSWLIIFARVCAEAMKAIAFWKQRDAYLADAHVWGVMSQAMQTMVMDALRLHRLEVNDFVLYSQLYMAREGIPTEGWLSPTEGGLSRRMLWEREKTRPCRASCGARRQWCSTSSIGRRKGQTWRVTCVLEAVMRASCLTACRWIGPRPSHATLRPK